MKSDEKRWKASQQIVNISVKTRNSTQPLRVMPTLSQSFFNINLGSRLLGVSGDLSPQALLVVTLSFFTLSFFIVLKVNKRWRGGIVGPRVGDALYKEVLEKRHHVSIA